MAFEVSIPRSKLAAAMESGFETRTANFERLVAEGQHVTLIISDGPFGVPATIGGANVLGSKQIEGPGLLLAEWLTRM